jgi:predicted unusual protein kinase regulating ubiquinone biosynthesis (AarF/ABC1/UbiB family)
MTAMTEEQDQTIDRSRYRQILWFFARLIAHLLWWDLLVGRVLKERVHRTRPDRFRRLARRFRELAVRMGGVMIKLGQFLSTRVDVLPPEITEELAGLQDEVPPVPFDQIRGVIDAELTNAAAHFADIRAEPLAAASLGQAHFAWLASNSQRPVVIKVQRPGIEGIVRTDLAALRVVARWTMRYPPIRRRANVPALLEEFAATLWEELDYISEADNAVRFAEIFAGQPDILIPIAFRQHSTGRVLVLEDVSGIKVNDVEALVAAGVNTAHVARRLMDAYFRQIFHEGFFHADPHPGNLFIIPEPLPAGEEDIQDRPFRLAFVDFGMVGHVEELMGQNLKQLLIGVSRRDARTLTEAFRDLGFFLPGSDLDRITEAVNRVLAQMWGRNLLQLSQPDPREVQEIGREFRDLLFEFPFQIPQDFIYLGRTMGILSGLASVLDPEINPWHLMEQYGKQIIQSRERRQMTLELLLESLRPFITVPGQLQRVLADAESGRLRLQTTPDRSLLRRLDRLERRTGRLNWTILVAALYISGTLFFVDNLELVGIVAWVVASLILLVNALIRD